MSTFEDLKPKKTEAERVENLYDIFTEETRLNTSNAATIEFQTNIHYIDKYLKPDMRLLDLGAGTGVYSLHYAQKGFDVTSVELVEKHVQSIRDKKSDTMTLDIHHGSALDLSQFPDESFDVCLCFGPLYHLEDGHDQLRCVQEAQRVTKKGGHILYAFIANDMVVITETMVYSQNFMESDEYDHSTFKVNNHPFVFHTFEQIDTLFTKAKAMIVERVGSDGLSELLFDKINAMSQSAFKQWFAFHLKGSNRIENLAFSNHLLYIEKKA